MKDKAFFDTNVLLYLFSEDEQVKNAKSVAALNDYKCITSTQTINELCNVFTKKWKLPVEDINVAIGDIKNVFDIQLIFFNNFTDKNGKQGRMVHSFVVFFFKK